MIKAGLLVTPRIQDAFYDVDRGDFINKTTFKDSPSSSTPTSFMDSIYANRPLKIGSIANMSTPQQHAQVKIVVI